MRSAAAMVGVGLFGVVLAGCGVTASPSSTPTAASATPLASVGPLVAPVVARISLPHPDAQTADEYQVAVTDDAIWIAGGGRESALTQVDVATNQVASDVRIEPALLSAAGSGLWMLSPWGFIPGPASMDLSRVDLQTGQPQLVAEVPANLRMAVGQAGVLLADGELRLLDAASGEVIRVIDGQPPNGISVACGALWGWDLPPSENDLQWTLSRLDPETGQRLDQIHLPDGVHQGLTEIDGLCWTNAGSDLYGISPRDGSVITSTVPGTDKIQMAGGTMWSTSASGLIQRVDPRTGAPMGEAWQLPPEDQHRDPKGQPDWRLLSAGGSLWLLGGDRVVRYDIPASQDPLKPGASVTTACEQAVFRLVLLEWGRSEFPSTVYENMLEAIFAACTFDELIAFGDKVTLREDMESWSARWDKELSDDRCQVGGTFAGSVLCETSAGRL